MKKFARIVLLGILAVGLFAACGGDGGSNDGDVAGGDTSGGDTVDDDTTGSPTWTDSTTDLIWQNPAAEELMTWQAALDYCAVLSIGDGGWRLPTINELRTLIRACADTVTGGSCGVTDGCLTRSPCGTDGCSGCTGDGGPAAGCYWPNELQGACNYSWSSSSVGDDDEYAWSVRFDDGSVVHHPKDANASYVRCVR